MKRLLTFLFVLISYIAVAQTQPALPPGSQIYSSNLFLAPDSTVWTGKGGLYINLGSKRIFDQLLAGKVDTAALNSYYTKTQVDAFLLLKENIANKVTDLSDPNDTTYPTTKAVKDAIDSIPSTDLSNYYDKGETDSLLGTKIDTALLDKPNGIPLMDANGKIKIVNIPDQLIGAVNYQGTWSPVTNTPALPAVPGPETKGHYYVATDSAEFNGEIYRLNDWIISSGSEWQKIEATNYVRRVNGQTGDVVITAADIGAVQTLSQPAIGQIAISSGNTINLNTVNTSGNQIGIEGAKTWTGAHTFSRTGVPVITLRRDNSGNGSFIKFSTTNSELYAGIYTGSSKLFGIGESAGGTPFFSTSPTQTRISYLTSTTPRLLTVGTTGILSNDIVIEGKSASPPTNKTFHPVYIKRDLNSSDNYGQGIVARDVGVYSTSNADKSGAVVLRFPASPVSNPFSIQVEGSIISGSTAVPSKFTILISSVGTNIRVYSENELLKTVFSQVQFRYSSTGVALVFGTTGGTIPAFTRIVFDKIIFGRNTDSSLPRSVVIEETTDLSEYPTIYGTATEYQTGAIAGTGSTEVRNNTQLDARYLQIDAIGNGTLSLATSTGLTGTASFTANQTGNATFTVGIASGYKLPTTTEAGQWGDAYNYSQVGHVPLSQKGAVNGVATLGAGGVIPWEQLPTSNPYKGTWDASTNTPSIADGTGTTGDYYRVNVAGTQDLGSGNITFAVGDDVIYSGTVWQRVPGGAVATNLGIGTHNGTSIEVTNSNGTGITLPAATTLLAGLQSAADKVLINSAVQPADNISALTNDAGFIVSGTGDAQIRTNLQLDGRYAQLSGATFTGPVLWATAPTIGDHLTNKRYVDTAINNAISGIPAGLELGETETTAYRGDRGKIAYDYSQVGHLPLTGGTVTGAISWSGVPSNANDLVNKTYVDDAIASSIDSMSYAEITAGTSVIPRSIKAKTLHDWLASKSYISTGASNSLLANTAGYLVGGTDSNQVRNNYQLDLRYLQTEVDPTVPSYVKSISESDILSWNNKVGSIGVANGVKNTGTASAPVLEIDSVKLNQLEIIPAGTVLGMDGGGVNTWVYDSGVTFPSGFSGEWSPNLVASNDVQVVYQNNMYRAVGYPTMGVPPPSNPSGWTLIASNVRGQWYSGVSYATGEASVYISGTWKLYRTSAPIVGIAPDEVISNVPGKPKPITVGSGLMIANNQLSVTGATAITGLIQPGANITITGLGTSASPYTINSSGGGGGGSSTLSGLSDVSVSGATNGQVLTYQSGVWVAQAGGGGGSSFRLRSGSNSFLTGDVTLLPGSGVSFSQSGNNITISSTGGGGGGGIAQLTGDVTTPGGGSGSATIVTGAVTNTKMANMSANTVKGRVGSSGAPQDLNSGQLRQIINSTGTNSTTTIDMSGPRLLKLAAISSNTTYALSNLVDGAEVQATVTNTGSNTVDISITGAVGLGSTSIAAGKVAVISIQDFGGGTVRYVVVTEL